MQQQPNRLTQIHKNDPGKSYQSRVKRTQFVSHSLLPPSIFLLLVFTHLGLCIWAMCTGKGSVSNRKGGKMAMNSPTKNTAETEKKKKMKYKLISYMELPEYMKDNEYILQYYRAEWPLKEAFLSLFRWHNETLNIWTHLIGFLLFLALTMGNLGQVPTVGDLLSKFTRSFLPTSEPNFSHNSSNFLLESVKLINLETRNSSPNTSLMATRWPFFVFLGGSMFCLFSSSMCHLLSCHSHRLNLFLLQVDYAGIAVMIITSFFPPIYYIFQCEPHWQFIYLAVITAMGFFTVFTLLSPQLSSGTFRAFRAMLFSAMGFSGIVPAIHALVVNWREPQCPITLAYELAMALFYVTGTLFYVSRVPEKWKPGSFDLAGHSHQIFHVFVIAGALAHYAATLIFLEWRDRVGCNRLI